VGSGDQVNRLKQLTEIPVLPLFRDHSLRTQYPGSALKRNPFLIFLLGVMSLSLTACSRSTDTAQPKPTHAVRLACPAPSILDRPAIKPARAALLIGMSESGAEACARRLGWAFRVGSRDGEDFALTMDYSTSRVTVSVKKNTVFKVVVG
jgi:hypothetical protein